MPGNKSKKNATIGRRSGVNIDENVTEDNNGMDDPDQFFSAVARPAKHKVHFEMGSSDHPKSNVLRHLSARKSIDTADLSTVMTAAGLPKGADPPEGSEEENDDGVDPPIDGFLTQPSDEEGNDPTEEIHEPDDMIFPSPPTQDIIQDDTSFAENEEVEDGEEKVEDGEESDDGEKETIAKQQNEDPQPEETEDGLLEDSESRKSSSAQKPADSDDEASVNREGNTQKPADSDDEASVNREGNTDFDDDDDKDGPGFDMNDPEDSVSPPPSPSPQVRHKKQDERKKPARKKKSTKKMVVPSEEETEDEEVTPVPRKRRAAKPKKKKVNPFATTFSSQGIPQPRTFDLIPISAHKPKETDPNLRRSQRARLPPLEFWRGEHYVYGPNDFGEEYDGVRNMSVVKGVERPNPTPFKKRPASTGLHGKSKKRPKSSGDQEEMDLSAIRRKYQVNEGKHADLWCERTQDIRALKVVSYFDQHEFQALPIPRSRSKKEGKVAGLASQSFNVGNDQSEKGPSFIMGSLKLPPGGIKDAEPVGLCCQVFTVVNCQPRSVELAFADPDNEADGWDPETAERFFVSPGDNFTIPRGNAYRLQNHSKSADAFLSWSILRPHEQVPLAEDDEE